MRPDAAASAGVERQKDSVGDDDSTGGRRRRSRYRNATGWSLDCASAASARGLNAVHRRAAHCLLLLATSVIAHCTQRAAHPRCCSASAAAHQDVLDCQFSSAGGQGVPCGLQLCTGGRLDAVPGGHGSSGGQRRRRAAAVPRRRPVRTCVPGDACSHVAHASSSCCALTPDTDGFAAPLLLQDGCSASRLWRSCTQRQVRAAGMQQARSVAARLMQQPPLTAAPPACMPCCCRHRAKQPGQQLLAVARPRQRAVQVCSRNP